MFGNNAITSSWANPQQNQQQQPQQGSSAFGQPSAFGSTGFGSSTGAFGQPQQQPQANPMFGGLGGSNNTGGSGFGAFGGATNQASTNTGSAFGSTKPATGFGAFGGGGGTGAFGTGTSTFGNAGQTTTNAFSQPAGTSAFGGGTGGSIFGQPKATTSAFGTTTTNATVPVSTGSSNPPYATTPEKDSNANVTLQYQSISCMPAYAGTSFEELRVQDYQQGRKTATTSAFGQPSGFGGTQTTGGSLFGQPQNNQPAQTNSIFGAPKPQTTGFGVFGNTAGNTGTFGTSNTFGQPQQQQQQQQAQPSTGFGFGQTQQQPQQQTGSLFGNTNSGGSTFGNTNNTGGTTFGTGIFGTNTNQPQQQTGSIFGQPQPAANAGGGVFGNNAAKPSIFGQPAQPAGQTSIFGQPAQQNQQQPQPSIFGNTNTGTSSLFGNNANQQQQQQPQQAGGSLFGNTQNAAGGTGTGGIFGSNTGTGLFGNTNNQQQQQPQQQAGANTFGGSLFGAKPAAPAGGGIFGTNNASGATQPTQQQPSLFGNAFNQSTNPQQPAAGGGLFNKAPSMGMSTSTGIGGSLFGNSTFGNSSNTLGGSTAAPGQQNGLVASINQPIAPNLPIFSMLPPGPRAVDLEQSTKKKVPFFVDIPTRSPVPRVQLGYTPASSKLRGFGSLNSSTTLNGSVFAPSNSTALTLSRSQTPKQSIEVIFGTQSSASLGSGQKKSVKKLILDKKVEPTELFVKSGGSPLRGGKITFSPALSIAAREREAAAAASPPPSQPAKPPTPTPQPQRTTKKFTASQNGPGAEEDELQEGDYYVKPKLEILKSSGFDQLSSFKDLVVGRVGYGEIRFLDPVDLTGLLKLSELLGGVIRFEDKECSVYPDADDTEKPPEGSGLNVRARISLKRCWAIDKAHREPIKDEKHPAAVKHLKKLRNMKDTHFENFDFSDGTWTFTVDHF
ncbi:nucleoporin autopeptidase-domain-containing protein [Lentinula raphanica]|uniref:Nucleoporin autopeptidase-domain-containing protein n=1 Tax=Lentinula raphanica TaxID=153919 RepID=A0AA38UFJ0_9AGAR|nr:nucleoporin autopeptidase-domain-containing protein [Lentinula raphanica]KAJ3825772.1 nucleoporin autopeptidase-domain-containing protein [Lentinula raphanica]KAJ3839341.1 nucleoporin autopeptidase-domain-containing protein [Lentinula raphanica]KAJ3972121.1 nucleoporin autopeptidase-domain-containing protein [Lentinula raphanica]